MPRPKTAKHGLEGAKRDVAKGVAQADAARRHGLSLRTLERALAEDRKRATPKTKSKPRPTPTPSARDRSPPRDDDEASLLDTLNEELRHARRERRNAENSDAETRAWAKTIRELVTLIERIAPPPPPPPDQVVAELRRLDGITIEIIEQFFDEPIKTEEIEK